MSTRAQQFSSFSILACVFALSDCGSAFAARTLVHEGVINASAKQVWDAFTTPQGMKAIMIQHAEVDLRVGGDIRTSYNPNATLGDDSTIINRILAFEPERMLSIQNVQAPKGFANAEVFQQTWTVLHFEPLAPDRTRLRIVGLGFGEGPEWDDVYNTFNGGNALTIDKLRTHFGPHSVADDPARVMDLLQRLTQGEWLHEKTSAEGKSVFRVRNRNELGPDGKTIVGRGWLGFGADGMTYHSANTIWREPDTAGGGVQFINIGDNGDVARGAIRLAGPDAIEWDWNAAARDGKVNRYRVEMTFEDERHYQMRILRLPDDAEPSVMVEARFEQTDATPDRFLDVSRPRN